MKIYKSKNGILVKCTNYLSRIILDRNNFRKVEISCRLAFVSDYVSQNFDSATLALITHMKSIHQIREEIESLPNEDLIAHLNYYRQNHLNILSIVPTESLNHFEAKARILSIYGRLLVNNGNYSEGYDILSKAKETFELDPFKSVNIDEDSTYRNLMLNLGMACYHTKRSEQAKSIFQKLIKLDPGNDNYQEWLAGISLERLVNLDKYFFYAFLVWLIGDVLFEDLIDELFKDLYLYLGIVLLVISISVGLYKRHIRKKMKQNITTNAR